MSAKTFLLKKIKGNWTSDYGLDFFIFIIIMLVNGNTFDL